MFESMSDKIIIIVCIISFLFFRQIRDFVRNSFLLKYLGPVLVDVIIFLPLLLLYVYVMYLGVIAALPFLKDSLAWWKTLWPFSLFFK